MRQEVKATIVITYDADAEFSNGALQVHIAHDLRERLIWEDFRGLPVEAVEVEVVSVEEEAEIYGSSA